MSDINEKSIKIILAGGAAFLLFAASLTFMSEINSRDTSFTPPQASPTPTPVLTPTPKPTPTNHLTEAGRLAVRNEYDKAIKHLYYIPPKHQDYSIAQDRLKEYKLLRDIQGWHVYHKKVKNNLLDYLQLVDYSSKRGGFGSILIGDLVFKNKSKYSMSDIVIKILYFGESETFIGSKEVTLYKTIKAGQTRRISEQNFGFFPDGADRIGYKIVTAKIN